MLKSLNLLLGLSYQFLLIPGSKVVEPNSVSFFFFSSSALQLVANKFNRVRSPEYINRGGSGQMMEELLYAVVYIQSILNVVVVVFLLLILMV